MQRDPEIEPCARGFLPVTDGHELYWETAGDPGGIPVGWLHGGPGSGCTPGNRRAFDPAAYRIVLLDQRGCGRSRPPADSAAADLSANTTDLVRDLDLPAVLIHGRLDVSGPLDTAWDLHRAWPASRLVVCADDGHGGEAMMAALVEALDGFRDG